MAQGNNYDFDLERLVKDLTCENMNQRKNASFWLGNLPVGIDRDPEPMIRALSDEDDGCRFWALTGLGCLLAEPVAVLPAVEAQLSDAKFGNRQAALHTLGAYCELAHQYVESIADCLEDDNIFVRESALSALQEIGPLPDTVISGIVKCLDDEKTSHQAEVTLKIIGPRIASHKEQLANHPKVREEFSQLQAGLEFMQRFEDYNPSNFVKDIGKATDVFKTTELIHIIALKYDTDIAETEVLDALLGLRNTDDFGLELDISKAIRSLAVHAAPMRETIETWRRDLPSGGPEEMIASNLHLALYRIDDISSTEQNI